MHYAVVYGLNCRKLKKQHGGAPECTMENDGRVLQGYS